MPFATVIMSGITPKYVGAERRAKPAEAGDHLVEDEQDAVRVADGAQPLEVPHRRHSTPVDPATGSTITAAMVSPPCSAHELLQRVGEVGAVRGLPAA